MRQETIYAATATYQMEDVCSLDQKGHSEMAKSGKI